MSEPLQMISFAESLWQMYVTSFSPPLVPFVLNPIQTAGSTHTSPSSPFVGISPRLFALRIQLINRDPAYLFYDHLVTLGGFSKIWTLNTDDRTKKRSRNRACLAASTTQRPMVFS